MKHTPGILKTMAFSAVLLLSASACNDRNNDGVGADERTENAQDARPEKDQADLAENHNDAKFDNKTEDDAQFAVDAAMMNLREIEASKVATTMARNAEVKALAQTMVTEHQKAYNELKDLASKKNFTIPVALGEDEAKKADKLREKDDNFDKKYTNMLVDEHKEAVNKFEKAAENCQDADLRAWAAKMLPALRHHLDMSMALNDKIKN